MENPFKMDDLGGFTTPIFGNSQMILDDYSSWLECSWIEASVTVMMVVVLVDVVGGGLWWWFSSVSRSYSSS